MLAGGNLSGAPVESPTGLCPKRLLSRFCHDLRQKRRILGTRIIVVFITDFFVFNTDFVSYSVNLHSGALVSVAGFSVWVCAGNRLGVVSAGAATGVALSSFLVPAVSGFEVGCAVFAFCRAALADASISAFASANVLPSARWEST